MPGKGLDEIQAFPLLAYNKLKNVTAPFPFVFIVLEHEREGRKFKYQKCAFKHFV